MAALTPFEIGQSLRHRADYFQSAEGGWRDDTAALLREAAVWCEDHQRLSRKVEGLKERALLARTEADHWKTELKALCELIVERARTMIVEGHSVSVMDHPDAGWVLIRAERLLHEMPTTKFARVDVLPKPNCSAQEGAAK